MSTNATEGVRPRRFWQVLVIGLCVGGWLLLSLLHRDLRYGRTSLPIILSIKTEEPLGADDLKLAWTFRRGGMAPFRRGYTIDGALVWRLPQAWVASLMLSGEPTNLERIETVTVQIGNDPEASRLDAWPSLWPTSPAQSSYGLPDGWQVRRMTNNPARPYSIWPSFARLLNYPGDAKLLSRALGHPVFLAFLGCFGLVLAARYRLSRKLVEASLLEAVVPTRGGGIPPSGSDRAEANGRVHTILWWLAGLLVMVICGVIVEIQEPYYFTQDDNYSQFFPGMLYGCRAAFAGSFPAWNPHQFLGAPLAEVGTYALTYPVTYLSYALATYVLGDELATVEVFCALHLIAGFAAFFWFGRRLGLAAPLCSAMGLCFVLSGYALVAGRSWYYMIPTFLWAPLLGVSVLWLMKHNPGWRWLLGTGVVIGLYFHAGNAQMWAYGMTFFFLALLWCGFSGAIPWSRLLVALAVFAVGLGLAAPLLVPQFLGLRGLYRVGGGGGNILAGLHALVVPYPLGIAEAPADLGTMYLDYFGQLYYAGSLFTLAWLAALLVAWLYPGRLTRLFCNPLFALGLVALLLCIGEAGVLWYVQTKLPVFNKFKHPVKVLPFFHLFSLTFGALVVHRLTLRSRWPGRWRTICFLVISLLLVYHASLARTSFYSFGDRPYPEMPGAVLRLLKRGAEPVRVMPVAQARCSAPGYTLSLANNFASVYGIDSISGHDPLVSFRPEYQHVERRIEAEALDTLRREGIAYLLVHATGERPVYSVNPAVHWQETKNLHILEPMRRYCAGREPLVETPDLRVFQLEDHDPMAFPANERTQALPIVLIPSGVKVDVTDMPQGGDVIINYLWYQGIRVWADGQAIPSTADPFGRIQANAPPGVHTLTVRYHSPWLFGTGLGAGLVAIGAGWVLLLRTGTRLERLRDSPATETVRQP